MARRCIQNRDQFFRCEEGRGQVDIDDNIYDVADGSGAIVPKGTGDQPLKLYTLYGPPEHVDGLVEATRADVMATHEE